MTLESYPSDCSSVNDFLVYVVNDAHATDVITYPNYKYVAELWIGGVKVFVAKAFPHPDTLRGIFNLGSIIREYVTAELIPSNGILFQELGENTFRISVVVKFREEFDGTMGAVVLTDSTRMFYNHYNSLASSFTILPTYLNKPLSTRPTEINLLLSNERYYLPVSSDAGTPFTVTIVAGTSTVIRTVTPTNANTMQLLNISPVAINSEYAGTIASTTENYTVTVLGTTYKVNVICKGLYTNYMVHFLNQFGGFETMLFNKVRKQSIDVEKKQFQQLPYRVNGSGVVSISANNIMHSQPTTFGSSFSQKLKINTDLLIDAEYQWLAQLVASPMIYIEFNGMLYPVSLTNTNYEMKEHIVDQLTNLSLNIEFGQTYKTQFA